MIDKAFIYWCTS